MVGGEYAAMQEASSLAWRALMPGSMGLGTNPRVSLCGRRDVCEPIPADGRAWYKGETALRQAVTTTTLDGHGLGPSRRDLFTL